MASGSGWSGDGPADERAAQPAQQRQQPDDGDDGVISQDEYTEQAYQTRMVRLKRADGQMEVREVPPLQLLRDAEDYGVMALLNGEQQDGAAASRLLEDGSFQDFVEAAILPNVIRPYCYWNRENAVQHILPQLNQGQLEGLAAFTGIDVDDLGPETITLNEIREGVNVFDLASMHPEDLMALMEGMTGSDADELQDEFGEKFRG